MARRGSSGTCRLTDMPLELLADILENLSWKDILHLRQTCKYLAEASRLWAVWAHQHKASTTTIPRLLEGPTTLYNSQELESFFLRWKRSQIGWKTNDDTYGQQRDVVKDQALQVHIVKGGRWLLTARRTGYTMYYDLEAEPITGRLLIPDQIEDNPLFNRYRLSNVTFCVDIDETSPILKFNLAFTLTQPSHSLPMNTNQSIQIWNISTVFDHSQRVVGLSAKPLASFPQHPSVRQLYSISLLGPYVAFSVKNEDLCLCSLVVDWEQADKSPSNYPCRIIYSHESRDLRLLSNNRMLTIGGNILRIYEHLSVRETPSVESLDPLNASRRSNVLWLLEVPGLFDRPISEPFLVNGVTRFVLLTDHTVYGLVIDDAGSHVNAESPPRLVKLLDSRYQFARTKAPLLGYYQGIAATNFSGAVLLHYSFPDERTVGLESQELDSGLVHASIFAEEMWSYCPVMDEGSGRVVLTSPRFEQRILVEFSRHS